MSEHINSEKLALIQGNNSAISAIAEMLLEMQVDEECEGLIPEKIKTPSIRAALLSAIISLSNASVCAGEWLENEK